MTNTFTHDDVVQYAYNELSPERRTAVKHALQTNQALRCFYEEVMQTKQDLSRMHRSRPSQGTVNSILDYARSQNQRLHEVD